MASTRHVILLTLAAFMSVTIVNAALLPTNYKEPSGAIDDLIVKSAKSKKEFEFFWDDEKKWIKTEDDILMKEDEWREIYHPSEEYRQRRGAVVHENTLRRWTDNTVYYEIKWTGYTTDDIMVFNAAMADWEDYTCVKFKYSDTADNRLVISNGDGCNSFVGMVGGAQPLSLSRNCHYKRTAMHELGHALGVYHEQSRPDRDNYVTVHFENMHDFDKYNFKKLEWGYIQDLGVPYDFYSIMHYSKYAFTNGYGQTITPKDPKFEDVIGNAEELSFGDIMSMNLMYKCNAACGVRKTPCPYNGFVGKDCRCWCPATGTTAKYCFEEDRERLGPIVRDGPANKWCEDQRHQCESWGKDGRCITVPDYVPTVCPRTCNMCKE